MLVSIYVHSLIYQLLRVCCMPDNGPSTKDTENRQQVVPILEVGERAIKRNHCNTWSIYAQVSMGEKRDTKFFWDVERPC